MPTANQDMQGLSAANYSIVGLFLLLSFLELLKSERIANYLPRFVTSGLGLYLAFILMTFLLVVVVTFWTRGVRASHRPLLESLVALLALSLVFLSIGVRSPYDPQPGLWAGFGFPSAVISLTLTIALVFGSRRLQHSSNSSITKTLLWVILPLAVVSPRLLLFVQTPNGLINFEDTSYHVVDELLAPMTGAFPYGEYTPQYTGMLGWFVLPLRFIGLSSSELLTGIVIACNLFNAAVPLLVVAISRRITSRVRRSSVLAGFIALWTVCGSDLGYSTQIREFSQFARFVPPLLALWLVLRLADSSTVRRHRVTEFIAGTAVALSSLNNADHGLTFAIALSIGLLIEFRAHRLSRAQLRNIATGFISSIASYCLLLSASGSGFNLSSYVGLRQSAVAGNVYAAGNLQSGIGPHLLVLMIPVMLFVSLKARIKEESSTGLRPGLLVGNVIGVWLLFVVFKFFLMPIPFTASNLFVPAFLGGLVLYARLNFAQIGEGGIVHRLCLAPTLLLLTTVVAAVFPSPNVNVRDELKRISGRYFNTFDWASTPGRPSDGYSLEFFRSENDFLERLSAKLEQIGDAESKVGYFGTYGGTVELVVGLDNVLGIPAPESLRFGAHQETLACIPVDRRQYNMIFVYDTRLPCEDYVVDNELSDDKILVYRRTN